MIATESVVPYPQNRIASVFSMPGLIGLYFGCRVCVTFLFFQADPTAGSEVSVALNFLLLIPVVLFAVGPATLSFREALQVRPFRWVLAFVFLALLSLTWSEAASRAVAFGYWSAMAADIAMVVLLLRAAPAHQACEQLLKGFVLGACLLALVAWLSPALPDMRLGDDEFLSTNLIGFEAAIGVLLCQYFAPQGIRWKVSGVILALTLVRSLSKTSIIAFVIVEAIYLARNRSLSRGTKVVFLFSTLLVTVIFWPLFSTYYAYYLNNSTQAETLTGRVGIWLLTLDMALREPWLGHGFHSFRAVIPRFGAYEPWHAHNELLQQFFNYGIVGVCLVITLYWSLFRQVRRTAANPLSALTRSLLLLVLICGLAETDRFDLSFPLWAITAISLALGSSPRMQEVLR